MNLFRFLYRGWLYIFGVILGAYGIYYILSGQSELKPIYFLFPLFIFLISAWSTKIAWDAKDEDL